LLQHVDVRSVEGSVFSLALKLVGHEADRSLLKDLSFFPGTRCHVIASSVAFVIGAHFAAPKSREMPSCQYPLIAPILPLLSLFCPIITPSCRSVLIAARGRPPPCHATGHYCRSGLKKLGFLENVF